MAGKTILITGSTSGIGLEVSRALLIGGAKVIMATKSNDLTRSAKKLIQHPNAYECKIDLADLEQIKAAVKKLNQDFITIDILINNAGVMEPDYALTKQGFESQFGINYLGHFALTNLMINSYPKLERIVSVSSLTALNSSLNYQTFKDHEPYLKSKSYGQSKLAILIFCDVLSKLLSNSGSHTISVVAHPGYSRTRLQRHAKGALRKVLVFFNKYLKAQSAKNGALPILFAACDPTATGNEYYVPGGESQLKGAPIKVENPAVRLGDELGTLLWKYSTTEIENILSK